MRKAAALCLTLVMALIAGCGGARDNEAQGGANGGAGGASEPLAKKTFTMLTDSNPTFPYKKDWPIWKWIEEKTGVTLDVSLPSGKLADNLSLVVASNNMPDIMFMLDRKTQANKYGQQGALVNILDYVDLMPNFKQWMAKYPDMVQQAMAADGKMYMFPNEGFGETNRMIWMYREDVFRKNGLKPPTTYDELYEVAKKLKQLYPDSYPFSFRFGERLEIFTNLTANFGTGEDVYYDFDKKEWRYGPIEDNYKKLVEYLHTFYREGLIPPDWLAIQTKQWQDMMSTNKAFITVDYISRIDFFNTPLRKENPEFNLLFMAPPAGLAGGKQQNPYLHFLQSGMTVASTSKHIKDIMKYMDFFYTEEGRNLASWGKEGETYIVENGKKKIKPEFTDVTDLRAKTGLATNGTYTWIDYDAHLSMASPELQSAYQEARKYDAQMQPKPAFNEQETEVLSLTGEAIIKHREENIAKFITGSRPLSEWDKYVEEAKNLGVQKIIDVYKQAYDRVQNIKVK